MADVPLVLNPSTDSITPKWNVIFDDWFATVTTSEEDLPKFNVHEWSQMFSTTTVHIPTFKKDVNETAELKSLESLATTDNETTWPLSASSLQQKEHNWMICFPLSSPPVYSTSHPDSVD